MHIAAACFTLQELRMPQPPLLQRQGPPRTCGLGAAQYPRLSSRPTSAARVCAGQSHASGTDADRALAAGAAHRLEPGAGHRVLGAPEPLLLAGRLHGGPPAPRVRQPRRRRALHAHAPAACHPQALDCHRFLVVLGAHRRLLFGFNQSSAISALPTFMPHHQRPAHG